MTKTLSWEELRAVIIQCMDENEKTTGTRRARVFDITKALNVDEQVVRAWVNKPTYDVKFGNNFRNEFVTKGGRKGGIYPKSDPNAPTPSKRKAKVHSDETNVQSLVHLLDSPPEQKTIESLLFETIRQQIAQNSQFADNILQIAARS